MLIVLAIFLSLTMALVPMQMSAYAATSASNVGTVEYNGSTYHARYNIQFTNTFADLEASPYKFKNLTKIQLVEKDVTNGWLTNYYVSNLKFVITKSDNSSVNISTLEDYNFYKSAPTKTAYESLSLSVGVYTLSVTGTISRGKYSSNINELITFQIIA